MPSELDRTILNVSPTSGHNHSPIFILGITPRSGTNFLHRLLCLHPECGGIDHTPVREGFFLKYAYFLSNYAQKLKWHWSHWGDSSHLKCHLTQELGRAIICFSDSLCEDERVVVKTPSVRGLSIFPELFPNAYLLVIIRDGRSVVASGMEGFGWNFEAATRHWANAARTILNVKESLTDTGRFRLVRYEDLNTNPRQELDSILEFADLDPHTYKFEEALSLPVYGSSFNESGSGVDWSPVTKTDDFSSTQRWSDWNSDLHNRFNWLAGEELQALDYEPQNPHKLSSFQKTLNLSGDLAYWVKNESTRIIQSAKHGVKEALKYWARTKDQRRG